MIDGEAEFTSPILKGVHGVWEALGVYDRVCLCPDSLLLCGHLLMKVLVVKDPGGPHKFPCMLGCLEHVCGQHSGCCMAMAAV